MPRAATHVLIPQPCHERWAAMPPSGSGRHCAACQKVVVDFTQKTDGEILAYLALTTASPCGRFRVGQLDRPLQPARPVGRWRSWLASVLALGGLLGSGRAAGQGLGNYFSAGPAPTVASPAGSPTPASVPPAAPTVAPATAGTNGQLLVHGVVLDATSGDRLPGVTVLLKGTTQGASTDANGEFVLELPASAASGTVVASFVGYTSQELPAASTAGAAPATIKLVADMHMLGEMVIVGGYNARKPWPWHPRRLYQWSKYQLRRPFRQ